MGKGTRCTVHIAESAFEESTEKQRRRSVDSTWRRGLADDGYGEGNEWILMNGLRCFAFNVIRFMFEFCWFV